MKKPIIGLTPQVDIDRNRYWMRPEYMHSIDDAGGMAVMLPMTDRDEDIEAYLNSCDGFVFTGGPDVDPVLYGEELLEVCGRLSPGRDAMEMKLMRAALEADKPILGICRGFQVMNVLLGGTLYQDLEAQMPGGKDHRMEEPYDRAVHEVYLSPDVPFGNLPLVQGVNSRHHQGVRELAPGLVAVATSPEGLIEAFWMPEKRHVWAVQWHPESFGADHLLSGHLFRSLIDAAKEDQP